MISITYILQILFLHVVKFQIYIIKCATREYDYIIIVIMISMLKHRAVFYTPGLGMNNAMSTYSIPVTFENKEGINYIVKSYRLPLITRTELDLEVLKTLLVDFDKQFVRLCEYFFDLLIPKSYLESNKVALEKVIEYNQEHLEELEIYSKNHSKIVKCESCQIIMERLDG